MSETNGSRKRPLPEGWVWTALGDVCNINMGQSPPSDTYNTEGIGLPFFQGKAEFGALYPTPVKWCSKPQKISEAGDILLSVRAPVGSTNLNREMSCIGRGLAAIKPREQMNNLYFLYYLRYSEQDLIDQATGTTFQAVSGKVVRNHSVPLAPVPEQHRIVAEIEKQFTRLDAAVAALKRAKANLARYKAAVLKAAVEGRLVAQDAADEPASALLERILAERRAQWEAANPKKKYVEPKRPDVAGLPELPVGWVWAGIEEVSEWIVDCLHSTPKFVTDGKYCIDTTCIEPAKILFDMARFVTDETFEERVRRLKPKAGDILFAREGTIGTAVMVPEGVELCLGQRMMQFRIVSGILPEFIMWILLSPIFEQQWKPKVIGTTAPHVNIGDIRLMAIPLAPFPEQERIVKEIESRLSVLQTTEKALEANLARAEHLRQGVLGKAFRGELVASGETSEVF